MLKTQLDKYVIEYETKDFIKNDPVQFIHKYNNIKDIEIVGDISSAAFFMVMGAIVPNSSILINC